MKKQSRKFLAVLLSMCVLFGSFGTAVSANILDDTDNSSPKILPAETNVAQVGDITYPTLAEAVAAADNGQIVTVLQNCSIDKIEITKGITITSEPGIVITVKDETTRNNTGATNGFQILQSIEGVVTFDGLTIVSEEADNAVGILGLITIHVEDENGAVVNVSNCTLVNIGSNQGGYRHAISIETLRGNEVFHYTLNVENCNITSKSYGIGEGLHNGHGNYTDVSLNVQNTSFASAEDSASSIYNIHLPKALKSVWVEDCVFSSIRNGGIKYIFTADNKNNVVIKNNDFSGCNSSMANGSYAIMCTNSISDLTDPYCYCWATEISENNLCGQNVIIALKAELETIWFPDGQAVNSTDFNNLNQNNTTDSGTRYGKSNFGGSQLFKTSGVVLTDFNIADDSMSFETGDDAKTTAYYYNTKDSSGFYTNYTGTFSEVWTEENPRHCGASLATWAESNAVTRWTLEGISGYLPFDTETPEGESIETRDTITAENEIAKVVIDTKTGEISVTPKAVGSTKLTAIVGGGKDGSLPNAKYDVLTITVSAPYIPSDAYYDVTVNYYDSQTGKKIADSYTSGSILEGSRYDVASKRLESIQVGEIEYTLDREEGDALSGYLYSDKIVNLYYTKAKTDIHYTIVVNYYDSETGEKIADSYISDPILADSQYDVTDKKLESIQVNEAEYMFDREDGDALSGKLNSDKTINLYYTKTETIIDPKPPTGEIPEIPEQPEKPVDPETPGEEVDIPEVEVPKADVPEDIPQTGDSSAALLWSILTLVSGTALVLLLLTNRKKVQK